MPNYYQFSQNDLLLCSHGATSSIIRSISVRTGANGAKTSGSVLAAAKIIQNLLSMSKVLKGEVCSLLIHTWSVVFGRQVSVCNWQHDRSCDKLYWRWKLR